MDIGVYLPQVGFTWDELRARVEACDALGIFFHDRVEAATLRLLAREVVPRAAEL